MKAKGRWLFVFFVVLCLQASKPLWSQTWRVCIKVTDGDTIVLDGDENIRLIGIDAPELSEKKQVLRTCAILGYEYLQEMLEHKYVRLEFDSGDKDSLSRRLAYVFTKDGRFVNEIMIREGFAFVGMYAFKYKEKFLMAQENAKKERKCLWKDKPSPIIVYISENGKKYHRQNCKRLLSKTPMSLSEACQRGYKPCKWCRPTFCILYNYYNK